MKKLAFYTLTGWSIGKIESEVSKYFPVDWDIKWFDFRDSHDASHFHRLLDEGYDFYSSGYAGYVLTTQFNIPPERMYFMVYDENELLRVFNSCHQSSRFFNRFKNYGVFSNLLRNTSVAFGIERVPYVLPLGIHVNNYTHRLRTELNTLGYAQKFQRTDSAQGFDIKRGPLAEEVAKEVGLSIKITRLRITGDSGGPEMNEWYQGVDTLLMSSTLEGGPLAPFEAAACGIPTIGTTVGTFMEFALLGGGIGVSAHPDLYKKETIHVVKWLKENPSAVEEWSARAYEKVRYYDWKHQHKPWIDFFKL